MSDDRGGGTPIEEDFDPELNPNLNLPDYNYNNEAPEQLEPEYNNDNPPDDSPDDDSPIIDEDDDDPAMETPAQGIQL